MNKKLEIRLKRRVVQLSATFFALVFIFSACKKEETEIGGALQDGNLNVQKSDTFSLITYSELIDSMESDETSVGLLGAYNDPVFGAVNCGIVTQIVPEAFTQDFPDEADLIMDSVVLALRFTSINYYANLQDISVEVYEIDDILTRDDQVYHTFDEPNVTGEGNLTFSDPMNIPVDIVKDAIVGEDTLAPQIRIRLKNSVGEDWITDSKTGQMGADFSTATFKGLYIRVVVDDLSPDFGLPVESGTVLYFSLEDLLSKVTMYYHTTAGEYDEFDFDINSTCARYNRMDYDRDDTRIKEALDDQSVGEELFFMQGGAVRAVIELPYITDFFTNAAGENDPKIINQAELVLPIQDFQMDVFDPSTSLFIARIVDDKLSTFTEDYGFGSSLSGNTVSYDETNKEFRFTMTREIHGLLAGTIENVGYRIYAPAFFASTVERIIFNGSNSILKDKPRLEITYTEY